MMFGVQTETANVLSAFSDHALRAPDAPALLFTSPGDPAVVERATYGELKARAETYVSGLRAAGLHAGQRVILASPLSTDFYALAIAVVGSGMELVLIDGRLDRRRLLSALRSARASAIVSVASALQRWPLVPPLWRARRYAVDGSGLGIHRLQELLALPAVPLAAGAPDAPAVISFTSGSTGRAKGVVRTNAILAAQHAALSTHLPSAPGDVDMTCFPAVVLHNLGSGVCTVLPPVDLREPASIDPAAAVETIRSTSVSTLSGAPAFLARIATHLNTSGENVPSVRRVVAGGAPVSRALARELISAFPAAEVTVVYGSTEAEPIALVGARELIEADGDGVLVGRPVGELQLVTLPSRLDRPAEPSKLRADPGEVVVTGPNVSRDYVGDPEAVARNKVFEPGGRLWHRTGDLARLDAEGRLWLLGRVGDAVSVGGRQVHPLALEAALADAAGVQRAALVEVGGRAVLAVEGDVDAARGVLAARGLGAVIVRGVDAIPVDARHQSKVDRAALAELLANPPLG